MHNIWLIARREYLERVRTKASSYRPSSFPLLMAASSSAATTSDARHKPASRTSSSVTSGLQLGLEPPDELESAKKRSPSSPISSPRLAPTLATASTAKSPRRDPRWLPLGLAVVLRFQSRPQHRSMGNQIQTRTLPNSGNDRRHHRLRPPLATSTQVTSKAPCKLSIWQLAKATLTPRHPPETLAYALFFLMYMVIMLLWNERRPLHHRRENLAHLRGPARHHPPRRDDGWKSHRRRLA